MARKFSFLYVFVTVSLRGQCHVTRISSPHPQMSFISQSTDVNTHVYWCLKSKYHCYYCANDWMITLSTCGDSKQAAVSYSLIHPEKQNIKNALSVQIKSLSLSSLYVDQADYRLQFIHKTQYYLSTWEACLCSLSSDHDGRWRRRKVWH